jgi:Protein of unknown function (DUF3710)
VAAGPAGSAVANGRRPGGPATTGPFDVEALDTGSALPPDAVDFGALRVPVPEGGTVAVEPTAGGRMQAVHISVGEGRLSVSALAAPKSAKLWPDLVREIDASLREGGARVRSFPGEWGRELHATTGAATSVFVGVDGPRWMVYGVATGPSRDAVALDARLRRLLRGTVVVRGGSPYPVRTVLPLTVPDGVPTGPAATPDAEQPPAPNGSAAPPGSPVPHGPSAANGSPAPVSPAAPASSRATGSPGAAPAAPGSPAGLPGRAPVPGPSPAGPDRTGPAPLAARTGGMPGRGQRTGRLPAPDVRDAADSMPTRAIPKVNGTGPATNGAVRGPGWTPDAAPDARRAPGGAPGAGPTPGRATGAGRMPDSGTGAGWAPGVGAAGRSNGPGAATAAFSAVVRAARPGPEIVGGVGSTGRLPVPGSAADRPTWADPVRRIDDPGTGPDDDLAGAPTAQWDPLVDDEPAASPAAREAPVTSSWPTSTTAPPTAGPAGRDGRRRLPDEPAPGAVSAGTGEGRGEIERRDDTRRAAAPPTGEVVDRRPGETVAQAQLRALVEAPLPWERAMRASRAASARPRQVAREEAVRPVEPAPVPAHDPTGSWTAVPPVPGARDRATGPWELPIFEALMAGEPDGGTPGRHSAGRAGAPTRQNPSSARPDPEPSPTRQDRARTGPEAEPRPARTSATPGQEPRSRRRSSEALSEPAPAQIDQPAAPPPPAPPRPAPPAPQQPWEWPDRGGRRRAREESWSAAALLGPAQQPSGGGRRRAPDAPATGAPPDEDGLPPTGPPSPRAGGRRRADARRLRVVEGGGAGAGSDVPRHGGAEDSGRHARPAGVDGRRDVDGPTGRHARPER